MQVAIRAPAYPLGPPFERALDLIFPPTCVGCRRVGRWICDRCWPEVAWTPGSICHQCGLASMTTPCIACAGTPSALERAIALAEFDGLAREAVHVLKYHGRHAIAPLLGRVMADPVRQIEVDLVVPVPLHRSRRRARGYDQSALLAKTLARTLDVPFQEDALKRVRPTEQQARLDARARRENVAGAFLGSRGMDGQTVLLVDDVLTTGATIEAAATTLKEAGAGKVLGIVFAHAA
jgi:ComF family protein